MNDYWHIPRASLASSNSSAASFASSSNASHKSHSNPPTVAKRGTALQHHRQQHQQQRMHGIAEIAGGATVMTTARQQQRQQKRMSKATPPQTQRSDKGTDLTVAPKRGSRSSQGSSDSNNSTRSAASGSLLLTAANLERFAEIHKKQHQHNKLYLEAAPAVHNAVTTTYNSNLVHAIAGAQHHQHQQQQQQQLSKYSESNSNSNNNDSNNSDIIITMDPNLDFIKTKDLDSVSVASSMHFTMVNGEGGQTKKPKRGLCDRGRQVTVLITSMSMIFLLLIMGMVYALEMRAREMPQS